MLKKTALENNNQLLSHLCVGACFLFPYNAVLQEYLKHIVHPDLLYRYSVEMCFLLFIFVCFYKKVKNFKIFPCYIVSFLFKKLKCESLILG
jgi:prolipoprotein diacylglyceryltransferase